MGGDGKLRVVVDGDATLDWSLARGRDRGRQALAVSHRGGGAVLLGELIRELGAQLPRDLSSRIEVDSPQEPQAMGPTDERFHHRFAIWEQYREKGAKAWRVEELLGAQRAAPGRRQGTTDGDPRRADLVVIHDAGLGFRDDPGAWPRALAAGDPPWVLLRMAKPVAKGPLWERLQPLAARTIVVIHIDDLRLGAVHVTRELSWERTAQDLMWELLYNPQVSPLAQCAHVVVSFTSAGALVFSRPAGGSEECRLAFDPAVMERMWNECHEGEMIGGVTALTASIARQVMLRPERPDVIQGVHRGIAALRTLDLEGYEERPGESGSVELKYPTERISRVISARRRRFAEVRVCSPTRSRTAARDGARDWTILAELHRGDLKKLAAKIVLEGATRALPDVPRVEFGRLLTFDRQEIEGLQSIRTLIRQYDERRDPAAVPLSIAVFGPPGAGKSRSVKEVASSVLGERVQALTFNLSQFDDPGELTDALHQVRDVALSGRLPLVLWDEFDTSRSTAGEGSRLGWLSHFLSPMADGEFQDGQLTHSIGRAVFVFAGGLYHRMDAFAEESRKFREAKAPDFLSRLSGYVDVAGPNPRNDDEDADPHYLIRRAVMLRSLLHHHWRDVFREEGGVERPNVDRGVLQALLLTREYRHGARSLAAIVASSAVPGRDRFERSDLPAESQLDLHVDARDFLDLVHLPPIEGELLERLAEAVHVLYCAEKLAEGASWGEPGDRYLQLKPILKRYAGRARDPAAADPALVAYQELPEPRKAARREEVREIPKQLAAAGYIMRPVSGDEPVENLIDLRRSLEAAAVERAADGGEEARLREAREALEEMRRKLDSPSEFDDADIRFHLALAAASGSEAMHLVMVAIRDTIARHLAETPSGDGAGQATLRRRLDEHGKILQAVEEHDGGRAAELIREHLRKFYEEDLPKRDGRPASAGGRDGSRSSRGGRRAQERALSLDRDGR